MRGRPSPRWPCAPAGRRCCLPRGKSLVASRLGSRVRPKPCSPHLFGSSGVCVGCCLSEDANPAAASLTRILSSRPCERPPPRRHRRRIMVVGALVPPDAARVAAHVATVYTNAPKRLREAVFADLCTLLPSHGRSRDRAGPRVPRHRRPHGPRDTRVLGPEATPPGGDTTSYPYELTKPLFLVCCRRRRAIWTRHSRAPRSSRR